jgi:hypothetical protein
MKRLLLSAVLLVASCAKPSKVSTTLEFGAMPPGLTIMTVRIKNDDVRASTPLLVDLSIETKDSHGWSKPESVLHPAGFVLKKQEQQILRSAVKINGTAVRATLTVKEQETGRQIQKQTQEKLLSGKAT